MPPSLPEASTLSRPVALWRRFGAMFYDSLALIGIWFVAGGIAVGLEHGTAVPAGDYRFSAALLLLSYGYFAFCWRRGGQTLGMRSWRIKLVDGLTAGRVSWGQTVLRFGAGLLAWVPAGVGYWWSLGNPERRGWPDRASATKLINVAKD